ncbi:MAG: carbonic anhydrase, partial [Pseudomonadota bacterium]
MSHLSQLIEGYRRFRDHDWARERERWADMAEGQSPKVMILSCADSRVDPAQIFDARPGEMFVVRNIAALAPPYETSRGYHGVSAALEFAV